MALTVRLSELSAGEEVIGDSARQLFNHRENHVTEVFAGKDLAAPGVNDLTLLVHHVVVFKKVFPDIVVMSLNLALSGLDGSSHPFMLDGHVVFHETTDVDPTEDTHQI